MNNSPSSTSSRRPSYLERASELVKAKIDEEMNGVIERQNDKSTNDARVAPTTQSSSDLQSDTTHSPTINQQRSIPLLASKQPIARHAVATLLEGLLSSVVAITLMYPLHQLLSFISISCLIDRGFLYLTMAAVNTEIQGAVLVGRESREYMARHYYCMWPIHFSLVILVILITGGKTGYLSIPLALLCWVFAMSSDTLFDYIKGRKSNPYIKNLAQSFVLAIVCGSLNVAPSFGVLVPVHYLAQKYPYWNSAVSGIVFPLFIIVLKKSGMNYLMDFLKGKLEKGEVPPDRVLPIFASFSKIISVCLTLANIVMMYLSNTPDTCALSAALSIFTEVIGKLYVAYITRPHVKAYYSKKAKRAAAKAFGNEAFEEDLVEASVQTSNQEVSDSLLAARFNNDVIAEKGCILVAAFIVYLFKLGESNSKRELFLVMAMFLAAEIVTDLITVHLMDVVFNIPILRLPRKKFSDFVVETIALSQILQAVAFGLYVVNDIVKTNL